MRALILDCETTGLVHNRTVALAMQPSIIEIYMCLAKTTKQTIKIEREIDLLIKPPSLLGNKPAGPRTKKTIESITGITDEMLATAPPFAAVADRIFAMLEAAPLVIAHNASFDRECLDLEAERLGRIIKWPRVLCTVEQSLHACGYRLNMANLHMHLFGESFAGAHRAKADVVALCRCVQEMHKRGWL